MKVIGAQGDKRENMFAIIVGRVAMVCTFALTQGVLQEMDSNQEGGDNK